MKTSQSLDENHQSLFVVYFLYRLHTLVSKVENQLQTFFFRNNYHFAISRLKIIRVAAENRHGGI